jgi:plasmid stabilization system protein ParE
MSAFAVAPEAENDTYNIWRYLLKEAGLAAADQHGTASVSERPAPGCLAAAR